MEWGGGGGGIEYDTDLARSHAEFRAFGLDSFDCAVYARCNAYLDIPT